MLTTKNFHFDSKTKTLSADASMLEQVEGYAIRGFEVKSVLTGKVISFKLDKVDYDNSHEDIMGRWYVPQTPCNVSKLLVVNS